MCRILAIRQKFIDAQSHFVTTAQLLSIASAQPMDAKEADQSRKAANKLEALTRSSPVAERGGGGGGRREARPEGEVFAASPAPASAGQGSSKAQDTPLTPALSPPGGARGPEDAHDEIVGFPLPTLVTQLHTACGSCRSCHAAP
jgi:hypothetical protein